MGTLDFECFWKMFVGDKEYVIVAGRTDCSAALPEGWISMDGSDKWNYYWGFGVNQPHGSFTLFIVVLTPQIHSTLTNLRPLNLAMYFGCS